MIVPVSLELLGVRVPVGAAFYPAEPRNIAIEVGNRPRIGFVPVVTAGSTDVAVFVAVVAAVQLQSCIWSNLTGRFKGGPVWKTARRIEGHTSWLILSIPFEDIG